METEIREMLRRKADDALREEALPSLPVRHIARRRARNVGSALAGFAAIAIAAVAVAGGLGGPKNIRPDVPRPPVSSLRLPEDASDVAVGFGSVWVSTDFSLVRVDAATPDTYYSISCPAGLRPIRPPQYAPGSVKLLAVGSDAVWMIGYRTPANAPCETAVRPTVQTAQGKGSMSASIQTTIDKYSFENGWALVRIDPAENSVAVAHSEGAGTASAVVATADAVWLATQNGGRGEVLKIDTKTGKVGARIPVSGEPASIAADASGVYVSIHHPPGTPDEVVKIDPRSAKVIRSAPHDVAGNLVARDGFVVLAGPRDSGLAVTGLDPVTLETRQPYYVLPSPFAESDVDIARGEIWVAHFQFDGPPVQSVYHGPVDVTGTLEKFVFDTPVDYLAATEDAVWVVGNVNGYGTLFKIEI